MLFVMLVVGFFCGVFVCGVGDFSGVDYFYVVIVGGVDVNVVFGGVGDGVDADDVVVGDVLGEVSVGVDDVGDLGNVDVDADFVGDVIGEFVLC